MSTHSRRILFAACLLGTSLASSFHAHAQAGIEFSCAAAGAHGMQLTAANRFSAGSKQGAFGFDLVAPPTSFAGGVCSSAKPFFFSIALPDGNYEVTLKLGGATASTTTVRAESRRLFVDRLAIPAGATKTETFVVNVRTATIDGAPPQAASVKLKAREVGALDWDSKLTLEFNGDNPSVRSIAIKPVKDVPTLYLAGDSTVVDQDKEPWAAWGQMLPAFFGPGLAISNQAESGETIRSFQGERRFDKIFSTIRKGDYLAIQFAHNDQKAGAGEVPAHGMYKELVLKYVAMARAKGATPILVTSMNRRVFDPQGKIVQTLGDYPAVMREIAAEQKVALIDLNELSKTLFEAMGPEGTIKAFVHFPANSFPGQTTELKDDTHFNAYGGYELARAIVQNIRDQQLPLAPFLRKNIPPFDPAKPDDVAAFKLPVSPMVSLDTPYGR